MAVFMFGRMEFAASSKAVAPINEIQYDLALETDQQDVDGQKPSTYIKNVGLATLSFSVVYAKSLGVDPRTEWGWWATMLNDKKPYPLILGGRPLGADMWLVVGVTASEYEYFGDELVKVVVTVMMDEYVRAGKKEVPAAVKSSGGGSGAKKEATGKALPPAQTNAQIADKAKNLLTSKK